MKCSLEVGLVNWILLLGSISMLVLSKISIVQLVQFVELFETRFEADDVAKLVRVGCETSMDLWDRLQSMADVLLYKTYGSRVPLSKI